MRQYNHNLIWLRYLDYPEQSIEELQWKTGLIKGHFSFKIEGFGWNLVYFWLYSVQSIFQFLLSCHMYSCFLTFFSDVLFSCPVPARFLTPCSVLAFLSFYYLTCTTETYSFKKNRTLCWWYNNVLFNLFLLDSWELFSIIIVVVLVAIVVVILINIVSFDFSPW